MPIKHAIRFSKGAFVWDPCRNKNSWNDQKKIFILGLTDDTQSGMIAVPQPTIVLVILAIPILVIPILGIPILAIPILELT